MVISKSCHIVDNCNWERETFPGKEGTLRSQPPRHSLCVISSVALGFKIYQCILGLLVEPISRRQLT